MSELLSAGLEIKRSGSSASVSSTTTYEFYSDGEFDKAEEYVKETFPSLSQPVSGSGSSTQPVTATPSNSDSVLSVKRKLEALFDAESDVTSSTPSSSLKLPKLADSRFNSGSNLQRDSSEASRPYVIDHMGFRSFFGLAPCGFYWELAIQISNGMKAQEIPHLQLRKSLLGKKSNVEVAPTVSQVIEDTKRKLEEDEWKQEEGKPKRTTFHDPTLVKAFHQELAAKMPWKELDREEEHESRNKAATDPSDLYFMDRSEGWYGGKVHFAAKLSKDVSTSEFSLILQKPFLGSSNRFTRRFGSKRFIRVSISDKDFYNDTGGKIRSFFHRPFVIFGRVFRAFFAKDHSVFLVQTNECCEKDPYTKEWLITAPDSDTENDQYNLSFFDFLNWHNPLKLNTDQPMAKWAARFALGLSNSVPGVRIAKEDYFVIDDVVAEAYVGKKKVPAEYTMTDGCGLANGDFFAALAENLSSEFRVFPTAVQVRINGAKGLLTIHPDHISPTPEKRPKVWIRESQRKIQYEEDDADVAHYIVDILRYARMSTPSQLSTETIINLAENGVPAEALAALMREWFQDRVSKLTTWDGPNGLFKLWKNVCREGRVIAARLARENPGSARARGLVTDDVDDEVVDGECMEDDELEELVAGKSKAWWEDAISGQPSSLEETCAGLLDAGFSPDTCSLLRTKLFEVAKKAVESSKTKYRIRVPLSCTAFVIPDPVGVLEPGECHIKFSSRRVKDRNGIPTDAILGPVLLTRHPCKVPTDVQKATAVVKYELRHYVDVIIVSTKGHIVNNQRLDRHLASMTGGGDYDGDLMSAFWQPELLEHFKPADPGFADEPSTVEKCLVKSQTTVTEFLGNEEGREISLDQKISRLQEHLLAPLKDASIVGKYSKYWENSIYANGYSHEETVRLAYIFCQVLDGTKTGVSIVQQIWDKDSRAYNRPPPEWKVSLKTKESQYDNPSNLAAIRRGEGLERFIMDILGDEVKKESAKQLKHIEEKLGDKPDMPPDEDLRRPWKMFHAKVAANDPELGPYMSKMESSIEEHVRTVFDNWEKRRRPKQGQKARRFTDRPITERQDSLRLCSQEFASGPDPSATRMHDTDSVARLKASYAYILAYDKRKHRFAFDVAYRTLCAIKAQAVSNNTEKTVTANFYARMDLHKLAIDDD